MEKDLGFSNIYQRARTDLTERCPYWLKALLKFRTPPGRVIELGCAHGGFVSMLRWAGFDASGLELSPAIAQIARDLFDIPMFQGPIEDQAIEPGSLDVIAMMDVLEHLPDPVQTMERCLGLLKPDGFLLIQTPKYPEGTSLDVMRKDGDRFVEQLKQNEHLYLFSARSVTRLFTELGFPHISFEPALFSHYDMFLTVSREVLAPIEQPLQEEALTRAASGRHVLAVLDLYDQLRLQTERFLQADHDRNQRLAALEEVGTRLEGAERDRAARLVAINELGARLHESETDRAARLTLVEESRQQLARAEEELIRLRNRVIELERHPSSR